MSCLQMFCDRLDGRPDGHACELPPGHVEACRCECEACLSLVALSPARAGLATY